MSDLTIMSPVEAYIAAHPAAAEVFAENHLDWQHALEQPLEAACTSQGVDLSLLLMDLLEVTASQTRAASSCAL